MESYRRRQIDCQPRFDQTFGGLCEQNYQDTIALKQRLETKTKRQNKTKQDKQNKTTLVQQQQAAAAAAAIVHQSGNDGTTSTALQSSVHVVSTLNFPHIFSIISRNKFLFSNKNS